MEFRDIRLHQVGALEFGYLFLIVENDRRVTFYLSIP
jgi:hypothetical protein